MTPKFHTLNIAEVRSETEDTVSILFDVPEHLKSDYVFLPGQYLTLRATINGEDTRRSYSICAAPHEDELRVAVKQVENGVFSSFANDTLKAGDKMDVMTPTGNFKLEAKAEHKKSYALFAAGSGITPILSIAKTILKEEPKSDISLFYGNKGFNTIIFREELEAIKNLNMNDFRLVHILSRENLGNQIQKGRIDKEKCLNLHKAFMNSVQVDEVFICGPESMIHAVKDAMEEVGVKKENIHFELFTSPGENKIVEKATANDPNVNSNVHIILDGEQIDIALDSQGDNILDAAQKAGADLPFACKGGVCCTCKAKILEGTAVMDVNYALEPDEVEAGYILTCQAHPTSEKLTVSFDD
ncbi:MAG: 1,2-phenylacetyl-CoA epoxidase subunit PaaE [Lishizhenia sp.]